MEVEKYYYKKREEQGAVFQVLLDPAGSTSGDSAKRAKLAQEAGADIILVGGSVGAGGDLLDDIVKAIKDSVSIPVVMFPGNINGVSRYADATYFMTLINTESTYWSVEAQILAAPFIANMKIESIPTAYIVLEPGGAVGWVGRARPVPLDKPDIAVACALAGKYIGSRFIITDTGSGAPRPAPFELVSKVKKYIGNTFYICGGGIKTPKQAADIISAGADAIQVGTAFEKASDPKSQIQRMVKAVREAGKARL